METITNLATFLKEIAAKKEYPKRLQIYLRDSQLGAEEAKALAMALKSGQYPLGLKLNLSLNQLGYEGVKALAMALQSGQCPPRLQLDLACNQLGAEEGKALAMALQSGQCPSGLKLNLGANQLGAEGAKAFAMAIQSGRCPSGLKLKLGVNQLGAEGVKALAMALQSGQCPQGLKLNLDCNQQDAEGVKMLDQAWAIYYAHQQDNFINCMTLYHGLNQSNSLVNVLPLEMLQEIYRHLLPATPILAKMTEISAKVFREQLAILKPTDTSEQAKQLYIALEIALLSKRLTEKAAKIKTAIHNFLPEEIKTIATKKVVQFSTVALLRKFHLLTRKEMRSITLSSIHQPGESEGQPPLKKMRL